MYFVFALEVLTLLMPIHFFEIANNACFIQKQNENIKSLENIKLI